ncbi:MAG: PTS sugar transporter subunit IIA [Elusimicrobia bacterium]|nr:PTS sugar transporter subunit IIA [Elusimicrobiota bacterium]
MTLGWFRKKGGKPVSPSGPSQAPSNAPVGLSNSVRFGKLLTEDLVLWLPAGKTKEQLIELLIERLCRKKRLGDPKRFMDKVFEREQGMSTTLDTGLSIPHARMDGINSFAVILGLLPEGMTDPKQPDTAIRAICVFFSPNRQEVFQQHLYLLRGISALFQPSFIDELVGKKTPGEVIAFIDGRESV